MRAMGEQRNEKKCAGKQTRRAVEKDRTEQASQSEAVD